MKKIDLIRKAVDEYDRDRDMPDEDLVDKIKDILKDEWVKE